MVSRRKTPSRRKPPSPSPEVPPSAARKRPPKKKPDGSEEILPGDPLQVVLEHMDAQFRVVIEQSTGARDAALRDAEQREGRLSNRIDVLEASIRLLVTKVDRNSDDIRKNSEDIRRNGEEISGNRADTASLRQSVDRLTAAVVGHGERIGSLEGPHRIPR